MPRIIPKQQRAVAVPNGNSILIFCQGLAVVRQASSVLGEVSCGQRVFGPFANGANLVIETNEVHAFYSVAVSPSLWEMIGNKIQRVHTAINSSGAIPVNAIFDGIITSSSLLGVVGVIPSGATIDAAGDFKIGDSFEWSAIAVGAGAFGLSESAGHNIIGCQTVNSAFSGLFRTRKAAAGSFTTYRIG